MSTEIKINYEEVYSKTAELRQRLQSEIREMDAGYRQVRTTLSRMDGAANAVIIETMEANCTKARVTAETMLRLISIIDNAAREAEREDQGIARKIARTRVRTRRAGGNS